MEINYGIPFIIAANKTDLIESLEKEKDGDRKLEFIAYSLRSYAIQYGAALVYLSCKEETNIETFADYVTHRLFNVPFRYSKHFSRGFSSQM